MGQMNADESTAGLSLPGRVALVTGASGSIGAEVSRLLAARGAAVAVHGRRKPALDRVVDDITSTGGTARAYTGDAREAGELDEIVDGITSTMGRIDLLVTLAGGDGAPCPTADLTPERWRSVIESDLTSTFLTIHAVLPRMLTEGGATIVTVSSTAGRRASRANAGYAAAKAGVVMLTEHLSMEYAASGVRVNCVAPSIVETESLRQRMPAARRDAVASQVPLGRVGQPGDVAEAVAYLSADASAWITGTTLDISGGMNL